MNSQQLTNKIPPVIDFLAIESSPLVEEARRRASAIVEEARTRLSGLPRAMRAEALRLLLKQLRSHKPNRSTLRVWWSPLPYRQSFWNTVRGRDRYDFPPATLPFKGFFTGAATINSTPIEGLDAPDCEGPDGFTRYERRAAKDNRFIGEGEEAEN